MDLLYVGPLGHPSNLEDAADGGEPKQLTTGGGYQALESPDGKLLFYVRDRGEHGVWSVPVNGGSEVPVLETAWHNAWAVSAKGIYYLDFDHATSSAVSVNRFDILTRNIVTVAKVPPPITRACRRLPLARTAVGSHGSLPTIGRPG